MLSPKHIGILGITAEGASLCYKTIVSEASKVLKNGEHPEITLHSFSYADVTALQFNKDWEGLSDLLAKSTEKLAKSGAEFAIMPANSTHYCIDLLQKKSSIPILSLVDLVIEEAQQKNFKKFAVLGIGMTMTDGLYEKPLRKIDVEPVIPNDIQQKLINSVIFDEIIPGKVSPESVTKVIEVLEDLKSQGCDSVGLCCTELPIIITEANSPLPFIDTTRLLAQKALEYSISNG